MTPLEADIRNSEFYKSFFQETLYLLPKQKAFAVQEAAPERLEPEAHSPAPAEKVTAPATAGPLTATKKVSLEPAVPFKIAGGNLKGVIVLVTLNEEEFKALPQQEFLHKILQSVGFASADVAYVNNISGKNLRLEALEAATDVNYIISFASRIETDYPHEKFVLYKPVVVNEVPIVFSQSLAVLDSDQEQKKLLWNALKQVFCK